MKSMKKDFQAVTKQLKMLKKKTEKLMKAVEKLEKVQGAAKRKPKAKAKTTRKVAVKKTKAVKKSTTATDRVLKIIKRSKKGIDVPSLMKKTRYDEKKVRNIISRAFRQGRVKRTGRGVYVGA